MKVFRNYEAALEEMPKLSALTSEDIYLCYIVYGRERQLEFSLRNKKEMIDTTHSTNCITIFHHNCGMEERMTPGDIYRKLEVEEPMVIYNDVVYHCGMFAPRGAKNIVEYDVVII